MDILKRIFKEIIAASDFDFTGAAEVSDIIYNKGEILTFKALFSVVPEFDLLDYKAYKSIEGDAEGKEDALTNYLLANTEVDIPASMVDYELNFSDENESEKDARKGAEERVKLLLVLKKIAKVEGVEIDKSDVDKRIEDMAVEYEVTTEQLRANLEQNNSGDSSLYRCG